MAAEAAGVSVGRLRQRRWRPAPGVRVASGVQARHSVLELIGRSLIGLGVSRVQFSLDRAIILVLNYITYFRDFFLILVPDLSMSILFHIL